CPFCVGQMEAMSSIAGAIEAAGARMVAVSPQTQKQSFFMHDQHKLAFPLLVDTRNELARQFGLVYRVPEEQVGLYRSTFVNLPFCQWRFQLGAADSGNVCDRSRWHDTVCLGERGLHGSAGAAGGSGRDSRISPCLLLSDYVTKNREKNLTSVY
ncbi:MAG: redoxin domain-containing protein, partial [Terriglobales bacterium]